LTSGVHYAIIKTVKEDNIKEEMKMKKLVNEIKKVLVNKEMSFVELDSCMVENGYYSVLDDGATEDIKADKCVFYTACDTDVCEVKINFSIAIDCGEGEDPAAFILKVADVCEC
jgi:hypothetical protein